MNKEKWISVNNPPDTGTIAWLKREDNIYLTPYVYIEGKWYVPLAGIDDKHTVQPTHYITIKRPEK